MDKDRDEILNELIKYYDEDKSSNSAEVDEENMGDTIVVPQNISAPQEESFGDTVVVNVKQNRKKTENTEPVTEETTTVAIPQPKAEEPVEEIFGNLGLDGKPIDTQPQPIAPIPEKPHRRMEIDPVVFSREIESEKEVSMKKTGIWYSLKPLWVTLITCLCLFAVSYAWLKGYLDTYVFNFKCNLELICESIGVNYHPFDDPENISFNPFPSVLANDNTIYLSSAQAGEGYTEKDNVRKKGASDYSMISERIKLLPFVEAGNSKFAAYANGVVCAKSNYICHINKKGEIVWEHTTSVSEPMLSVAGDYIAIAAKDGTQVNLYKSDRLLFSMDMANKIKTCEVSLDGDIALITEQAAYKGAVVVVNKKGEEVFSWVSGYNYITSVSNLQGRNIAVVLTDTSSKLTSYVMLFDIFSPEPLCAVEITDTLLYDSSYLGKSVFIAGDNSIVSVNLSGDVVYDMRFDDVFITRSAVDRRGNRLVTFTQDYMPSMHIYNKKGELVYSGNIEASPDCVDIFETTVLYNDGRNVICGNVEDGIRTSYTAPMSVKDLVILSHDTYVIVYEDTIEFIGI